MFSELSQNISEPAGRFRNCPKLSCKHAAGFLDLRKRPASMREDSSTLENAMQACETFSNTFEGFMHACTTVSNPFESAMHACGKILEPRNIVVKNSLTEFLICTVKPFDIIGAGFSDYLFANCKLPIAN